MNGELSDYLVETYLIKLTVLLQRQGERIEFGRRCSQKYSHDLLLFHRLSKIPQVGEDMGEFHHEIHDEIRLTHGENLQVASKSLDAGLNHSIHAEVTLTQDLSILLRGLLGVENTK